MEYKLNLMAAHMKARLKNEILPKLQKRFEEELNEGRILRLEQTADLWLEDVTKELRA